ncbi:MAG: hypothetical protein H7281_08025 [Bacteriovorax sp.]|nr:hypothetical protein [Bacteriovorax sp.]
MKKMTAALLLLLSVNAFSAQIQNCKFEQGTNIRNVVILNDKGNSSIQKILSSSKSTDEKKDQIKRILFIESVSIGDGNSVCELASKQYKVTEEKCQKVMKSSDLLSLTLEETDESDNISLECKIGVNAKLLMQFNM